MIESYVPGRALRLVRNPYFRVWSSVARPDGYPDEIEFRLGMSDRAAVTAVERGQADMAYVPLDRTEELKARHASQVHLHPDQATIFLFLNTRLPPFDDVRVRRALNYAVDRAAIARSQGGPDRARPTCQLRPPSTIGFQRYCPYTAAPSRSGEWKAPDLMRARRLVAASGTRGMEVKVWAWGFHAPAAREVVSALRRLGYHARLAPVIEDQSVYFAKARDAKTRVQAGTWGWYTSTSAPSLLTTLTCSSIQPGQQNKNPSFFCDRRIDAQIERALRIQATDPDAAVSMWRRIERRLVDRAPWVPLFTPWGAEIVSKRVGHYQYSPALDVLFDQLWVR